MLRKPSHHCIPVLAGALVALVALSGCATRSISNSGYPDSYYGRNDMYAGELSEFSVLGIDPAVEITEQNITEAFNAERGVALKPGNALLLIQSGAQFPDEPMQRELSKHFRVVPFSGAVDKDSAKVNLSKPLRLAAAQGKCDVIACYWGVLETAQKDLATKTVSWVPIVGRVVPDETQQMRIRLKMVLVDARTGNWTMIAPEPFVDMGASAKLNRESSDQNQVNKLKERAYVSLAEQLQQRATS